MAKRIRSLSLSLLNIAVVKDLIAQGIHWDDVEVKEGARQSFERKNRQYGSVH